MKKLFVLLAVMAFALTPCLAQTGKVNNFKIKRGTNVSHWLSQSEARGEMRRLHIQEEDFARLEKLGFDFVGCEIDEEYFRKGCERFDAECRGITRLPSGKEIVQTELF
jgi:endoglucanase